MPLEGNPHPAAALENGPSVVSFKRIMSASSQYTTHLLSDDYKAVVHDRDIMLRHRVFLGKAVKGSLVIDFGAGDGLTTGFLFLATHTPVAYLGIEYVRELHIKLQKKLSYYVTRKENFALSDVDYNDTDFLHNQLPDICEQARKGLGISHVTFIVFGYPPADRTAFRQLSEQRPARPAMIGIHSGVVSASRFLGVS